MFGKLKFTFSKSSKVFILSGIIQFLPHGFASCPLPEWHYMPKWLHWAFLLVHGISMKASIAQVGNHGGWNQKPGNHQLQWCQSCCHPTCLDCGTWWQPVVEAQANQLPTQPTLLWGRDQSERILFQPSWLPRFHYQEEWSMVEAEHHVWPRPRWPRWWSQWQAQQKKESGPSWGKPRSCGSAIEWHQHSTLDARPEANQEWCCGPIGQEQLEPFFVLLQNSKDPGSHTTRNQPKRHRPLTCSTCLLGRKMILKPAILGSAFIGVGSHPWQCIGVWFGIWHGMLHIVISCHLVYSTSEWNTIWSVTSP